LAAKIIENQVVIFFAFRAEETEQVLNFSRAAADGAQFVKEVERLSGQRLTNCYQCGKCTAGCPLAFSMDLMPHQVIRLIQLGLREEALDNRAVWLCSTCATCSTRCPRNVDLAGLMDALRIMARREGRTGKGAGAALFHHIFLDSVRRHGRAHELGIGLKHNLRTGKLFKDSDLARGLLVRGRLRFRPSRIKGAAEVSRIFAEVKRVEEGK